MKFWASQQFQVDNESWIKILWARFAWSFEMKKRLRLKGSAKFCGRAADTLPPDPDSGFWIFFGHLLWTLDVGTLYQTGYAYPFRVACEPTMVNLFGQFWDPPYGGGLELICEARHFLDNAIIQGCPFFFSMLGE